MMLFKTTHGLLVSHRNRAFRLPGLDWDQVFREKNPGSMLAQRIRCMKPSGPVEIERELLAPIGQQEVWAAGVTYYRSRDARIEEARDSGGGDFYARVYEAQRPELFFKATPLRVAGPGQKVRIRRDAAWNVPEPELTAAVNAAGKVFGYTIGNDMCSRDIEAQNPLYLPQAKIYDRSCALGPGVLLCDKPLPKTMAIRLEILRRGASVFRGATTFSRLKRSPQSLAAWLYRECSFPHGCFLMTGTGIVPPDDFTLRRGDEIRIAMTGLGVLVNTVA